MSYITRFLIVLSFCVCTFAQTTTNAQLKSRVETTVHQLRAVLLPFNNQYEALGNQTDRAKVRDDRNALIKKFQNTPGNMEAFSNANLLWNIVLARFDSTPDMKRRMADSSDVKRFQLTILERGGGSMLLNDTYVMEADAKCLP